MNMCSKLLTNVHCFKGQGDLMEQSFLTVLCGVLKEGKSSRTYNMSYVQLQHLICER